MHSLVVSLSIALGLSISFAVTQDRSFRAAATTVVVGDTGKQNTTVRVWVNTASGVYHCPGTRYFGATKRGKYLSEHDARSQGYRAAAGRNCGALASPGRAPALSAPRGVADLAAPISSTKVWVNTRSGVYHCPGTRYYGATKSGRYMAEGVARDSAYRPAYGRNCG